MTLAERVRAERERHGLSQSQLASAAGLNERTIRLLEGGRCDNPQVSTLARIAEVFGLEVADLVLAGPELLDVTFGLGPAGVNLGELSTLEGRIVEAITAALPRGVGRLAIWPWSDVEDPRLPVVTTPTSTITLRAPASAVGQLAELAGRRLPIAPLVRLSAPVVRPVAAAESLRVLVRAPSQDHAATAVRRSTTASGCCPVISVSAKRPLGSGSAWLAVLLGVPASASAVLQRLRVAGPEGLFVPA